MRRVCPRRDTAKPERIHELAEVFRLIQGEGPIEAAAGGSPLYDRVRPRYNRGQAPSRSHLARTLLAPANGPRLGSFRCL